MAAVDRTKYMCVEEVKQLRTVTEARAIVDLRAGRVNGPLAWMVVDLALSTGLRVSEIWKSACKRDPRREETIGIENGPTAVISVG